MVLTMKDFLDFETPIRDILREIEEFSSFSGKESSRGLDRLQQKLQKTREEIFGRISRWQKQAAAVARRFVFRQGCPYCKWVVTKLYVRSGD